MPVRKIRDQVRANMPETYDVLTKKYDGDGGIDLIGFKVKDALVDLFTSETDPDEESLNLTDFQAQFVGDYATHLLIPTAMEYYGVRTGRADSFADLPDGQSGRSVRGAGPGTGRQQYDRIEMLKAIDLMVVARMAANVTRFDETLVGSTKTAGMMVSNAGVPLTTVDPLTMRPIDPRLRTASGLRFPPRSWFDTAEGWQFGTDWDATTS